MSSLCGCYYTVWSQAHSNIKWLPQVDVVAHTTILSTVSETKLSQTFINPSTTTDINKCIYTFPLYDRVSVVGFTCQIGSRLIYGVVKEKTKAKEVYDEAVARGETAGLLEQGPTSDVFVTKLGNIPAGEKLLVTIKYIGELKHDVGANGIRFTLPSMISPRYGNTDIEATSYDSLVLAGKIAVTIDIQMAEDSHLREVRSPSHPIAVTLGRISGDSSGLVHMSRASATLALDTAALDKDFVLEVLHQDSGKPTALLEPHSSIPGQRALMATLVPGMPSPTSKPEIIFIADQSGSMAGRRTETLTAALKIFLKSLPVGIKFNICLFGTCHRFLFPKSQTYDQDSLTKALGMLKGLNGTLGGTETLSAVRATIQSRDVTQPLSVILATDGDIWQQEALFDYLNVSVAASNKALRVFALGIGNSVSSALIEGVARAGNGFAQTVGEGEKLDSKIVRMLRGALIPDNGTYTMEVQYHKEEDEDFVLVEKVTDSLRVMMIVEDETPHSQLDHELQHSVLVTSLMEKDKDSAMSDADGQFRYQHLPSISAPKLLQTPQHIPPLYPSSRTTVFVIMSSEAEQGTPKSVVLRGSSIENPFEMIIPVEVLAQPSTTIHQLAAKKAIQELEEGRGWLLYARDDKEKLVKDVYGDRFSTMVEREAVRLGVQYQIAGKYTSFVAVQSNTEDSRNPISETECIRGSINPPLHAVQPTGQAVRSSRTKQSARQSFGGKVPRKQLASKATFAEFQSFCAEPAMPHESLPPSGSSKRKMVGTSRGLSKGGAFRHRKIALDTDMSDEEDEGKDQTPADESDPLQKIVGLQTFQGFWEFDAPLLLAVGLPSDQKVPERLHERIWATILAITFLEKKMAHEKDAWEMVVEKAKEWLAGAGVGKWEGYTRLVGASWESDHEWGAVCLASHSEIARFDHETT